MWQASLPTPLPAAQKTVSSVKLCLSLYVVEVFYSLWNATLLSLFNVFYVSKKSLCVFKNKHQ
jgi:hypothetical protein